MSFYTVTTTLFPSGLVLSNWVVTTQKMFFAVFLIDYRLEKHAGLQLDPRKKSHDQQGHTCKRENSCRQAHFSSP